MTTNLVATESARILTEGVTKITTKALAVPKDIVSYSTAYFNKHKKKVTKIYHRRYGTQHVILLYDLI